MVEFTGAMWWWLLWRISRLLVNALVVYTLHQLP